MTVLKTGSVLEIPADGTEPGFKVTYNSGAPLGQQVFQIKDFMGAPIFSVGPTGGTVFGDHLAARHDGTAQRIELDGDENPPCMRFPDLKSVHTVESVNNGMRLFCGSGAPTTGTIGAAKVAKVGDMYVRRDEPKTYRCVAGGTPGTWELTWSG